MAPLATPMSRFATAQSAEPRKMLLSIHKNTSHAAGFLGSLDGWGSTGVRYVEVSDAVLDQFLERNMLAAVRRVLTDRGLTPVVSG